MLLEKVAFFLYINPDYIKPQTTKKVIGELFQ